MYYMIYHQCKIIFINVDCSNVDETLLTVQEVTQLRKDFMSNLQTVISNVLGITPFLAVAGLILTVVKLVEVLLYLIKSLFEPMMLFLLFSPLLYVS